MLDANKILQVYKNKGYTVDIGEGLYNICYIEGLDPDGSPNGHIPNHWDDLRVLWQALPDGTARIVGAWEATTRSSMYWTKHPMNDSGAFYIALGQQTCWTMGQYHDQIALIQTEPIRGTRDFNQDYKRDGDQEYPPGLYGVHHHWGYNYPHDDLGRSSAGCQVGRTTEGHNLFISYLKKDERYRKDPKHVWTSTVITADDYVKSSRDIEKPTPTGVIVATGAGAVVAAAGGTWYHPYLFIASAAFLLALGGILIWHWRRRIPVTT